MNKRTKLSKQNVALDEWLHWLERHPVHHKVAGSIPGWGMMCVCLSLTLSPSFSPLKSINTSLDEDFFLSINVKIYMAKANK